DLSADSFDSTDPLFSTNGQYDPSKSKDEGGIAAYFGLTNSVSVGNATIKGFLWTGPGGAAIIGPNGSVGVSAWIAAGQFGIQPGHHHEDLSVCFQTIVPPFTSGVMPPGGFVDVSYYDAILASGNYKISTLTGRVL